ncbi:MAG TPA: hypothetical protein VMF03_20040 [Steroidobacteraceae bacterium]|nr:hypothetical protein [Steroidobacteraceae bacterium]
MKTAAFLALLLIGNCAAAAEPYPDASPAQIGALQNGIEHGCLNAGKRKGGDPAHVTAVCKCVIQVLKSDVTPDEWNKAVYLAMRHQNEESNAVILSHSGKMATCRTSH